MSGLLQHHRQPPCQHQELIPLPTQPLLLLPRSPRQGHPCPQRRRALSNHHRLEDRNQHPLASARW